MARTDIKIGLTGKRFGRLIALRRVPTPSYYAHRATFWEFRCDCGSVKAIRSSPVLRGAVVSCGCWHTERMHFANRKHGLTDTPEHYVWKGMRSRCTNPNSKSFKDYGGRGIKVCERWNTFTNFLADMGPRPSPQHSIERENNDGDYEPTNCHWGTQDEQSYNTRRTWLINGANTLEIAQQTGLSQRVIEERCRNGWTADEILTTPAGQRRPQNQSTNPSYLRNREKRLASMAARRQRLRESR